MLPQGELSTTAFPAGFDYPVKSPNPEDLLQDWELGGVYLNDPSQGLAAKLWHLRAVADEEGDVIRIIVSAPGGVAIGEPSRELFSGEEITEVALAFDQNMNPFVAYVQDGAAKFWWYDGNVQQMVFSTLPAGSYNPRCCIDERNPYNISEFDVILSYVRAGNLCVRYQRERYQTEHVLRSGIGSDAVLVSMARNVRSRIQWRLRNYELRDDPGALVVSEPFLAEVVADLLRQSGVGPEEIDTTQLWFPIGGYRIATQGGADAMLKPLQSAYFFDPGSWDKKMRMIMRGADPVASLTFDDLLERDGNDGPMEKTEVSPVELLRKVNVTMVDSTAGWVANKQTYERSSKIIAAIGEESVVIPITATPDFTAAVAKKRTLVPWGEPTKMDWAVGIPWSALTPTDVITMTDRRGRSFRIRLSGNTEDYGRIEYESIRDAKHVYSMGAIGIRAPQSTPTVPGQAGDTIVTVLNIPVQRDQDDELGYYMAVHGTGDGWGGGVVQISLDGGQTIMASFDVTVPSAVGETITPLTDADTTLRVTLSEQPESVTEEDLDLYRNIMAVQRADGSWEVMQFLTATPVVGEDDTYDLSGLVRGLQATGEEDIAVGGAVVLIDNSLRFVRLQQWMIGKTVSYRGVSYSQDADEVEWLTFVADQPVTQREFPVTILSAQIDPEGRVRVEWSGNSRLGPDTSPDASPHFEGYRVTFSDGVTIDTMENYVERTGAPTGLESVSVWGRNRIGGIGAVATAELVEVAEVVIDYDIVDGGEVEP